MKAARLSKVPSLPTVTSRLPAALHCAGLGLRVFPLHSPTKTSTEECDALCSCGRRSCRVGKHPVEKGWKERATTDPAQIEKWWGKRPDANVGIYTGHGDLFVVDVDGEAGEASFVNLEQEHGPLPKTLQVSTGRGFHIYLKKPAGTQVSGRVGVLPGVDVRADGGYVVGPGSLHWSGATYDFKVSSEIAAAPHWLLALVTTPAAAMVRTSSGSSSSVGPVEDPRIAAISMEERTRRACAYVSKADPAISHRAGHNTAMRVATAVVRGFALSDTAAREVLEEWNSRCQPPWSDEELAHKISDATRVGAMPWGAKLEVPAEGFLLRSISELVQSMPEASSCLLPDFNVTEGRPTLLGGFSGVGKTVLAQELALSVAVEGSRCWGSVAVESSSNRVVHLDYEMGEPALRERYVRLARGRRILLDKLDERLRICSMPRLYLSDDSRRVEAALLEACDGVGLAVVDNLRAACPHAKSENDSTMRLYLDVLTRVSLATGCVFLVLAHESKSDGTGRSGVQRMRGSGAIVDAAGAVLSVSERRRVLRIQQTKASLGSPGPTFHVRFVGERPGPLRIEKVEDGEEAGAGPVDEDAAIGERIVACVRASPGINVSAVMNAVEGRREVVQRVLKALRKKGEVIEEPGRRGAKLLRLASGGGEDAL